MSVWVQTKRSDLEVKTHKHSVFLGVYKYLNKMIDLLVNVQEEVTVQVNFVCVCDLLQC